jgi:N-acetyl sugar amidotransferase
MNLIPVPAPVDPSRYIGNDDNREAFYGLPKKVKFCRRCVISNQRPNSAVEYKHTHETRKETINFDEDGVCDACHFAARKHREIDWSDREKQLRELCDKHRKHDGSYDCILPGSGGKDSFFASHILKTKYGMHPLTVTWAPHVYTDWGWKNFQSWIHAGHDNYLMTPNARVHRLLTRLSTELLFHPFQSFMFGQKALAPKMSLLFNIPLVFYGENEAEYGNAIADTETAKRDWSYFTAEDPSKIFLGGVSVHDLKTNFGVDQNDLQPYLPANPNRIAEQKVEVHYLGYYLKWHPQSCYYYAVEHGGFQASPERTPGTYSKYNSIDDRIDDFHYYTTGIKFGIGRASYDAAQEIRSGDINREEGIALVKRFDHEFPQRFADEIFRYLSLPEKEFPQASRMFQQPIMDRAYFDVLTDRFRSPHLWDYAGGQWKLRHAVWHEQAATAAR